MQVSRCTSQPGDGRNKSLCQDDASLQREAIVMIPESTLLCNRRKNNGVMQSVCKQQIGKQVPMATNTHATVYSYCWKRCFLLGPCRVVIRKTIGATQLVVSWKSTYEKKIRMLTWNDRQPGSYRLSWVLSSAREAVKIEPDRVKLKNLHC
jgi:hypothetical protein